MTCREVSEFLADYVSGNLSPAIAAEFDHHLFECANCREFLNQYRVTIAASAIACHDDDEIADDVVAAILDTLKSVR